MEGDQRRSALSWCAPAFFRGYEASARWSDSDARSGVHADVAHIEGDDLLPRLGELQTAGHELRNLDTAVRSPRPALNPGPTRRRPLGIVFGATSGDKGGNANIGVSACGSDGYKWLKAFVTVDRLKQLMPERSSRSVATRCPRSYR